MTDKPDTQELETYAAENIMGRTLYSEHDGASHYWGENADKPIIDDYSWHPAEDANQLDLIENTLAEKYSDVEISTQRIGATFYIFAMRYGKKIVSKLTTNIEQIKSIKLKFFVALHEKMEGKDVAKGYCNKHYLENKAHRKLTVLEAANE